ncbi:hypothetical protein [Mucilaginibacter sp.]
MKKIILGVFICAGLAACHGNNKPQPAYADSPMMTGKADQAGTINDSAHTAADADSQAVGKKDGAPTDTVTNTSGSGKFSKQ